MKKNNVKKKQVKGIVLLCVAVLAVAVIGGVAVWERATDYTRVLTANWGLTLPAGAKYDMVYAADSGASFHGDGLRYHVYSYRNEEPLLEILSLSDKEQETAFHESYSEAVAAWMDELDVPAQERPRLEGGMYHYEIKSDHSELLVILDSAGRRLFILESFL